MFVLKSFETETAHLLNGYSGDCGNLHGHTYKIDVEIGLVGSAAFISEVYANPFSMVMDFSDIKELAGEVVNRLDHAVLIKEFRSGIEQDLYDKVVQPYELKHLILPDTSAESIASYLQNQIAKAIGGEMADTYTVCVTVWETSTNRARTDRVAYSWVKGVLKEVIVNE